MRFNKQELIVLASQPSNNFSREGVLVLKEKQDGFFRRSEGCSVRWFRLRGNLLFYLKGPESWYEPMGVIILGQHKIKLNAQDENGHWPFQIDWYNGVCYKLATFHESERTLWLKSIELAPYNHVHTELAELKARLNKIRPIIDISTYRIQKGMITDINEVPLYELALSCDNLLCDMLGKPPSSMAVVYLKYPKGPMVRYGTTEVVNTCSNPSYSKTILFRASDGLTEDAIVKIVIYDVKEVVSDTTVPVGFTALQLSTIQEAQRLRVALQSQDKKTKGFVTINGWSLEPSYSGASPSHISNSDKNCIEIPHKLLCHRRSHSLPPKLGLKLKYPSYGTLFKQNFVNSYQVTYRFHSGLGGDITVHEIMAEPKICYQLPIQLLNIFIRKEKELLEGLLLISEDCGHLESRRMELVSIHISLLKHYCHAKQSLQGVENVYFKASSKKDDPRLEFAPTNLHLQRMWVYNDTLNKTGFHDVITAGAFTAHTHKSHRSGGLIRLVQQMKSINDPKSAMYTAVANKIQAEYDKLTTMNSLVQDVCTDCDSVVNMIRDEHDDVKVQVAGIKSKMKSLFSLWEPNVIEETLSCIGWNKSNCQYFPVNQLQPTTVFNLSEHLTVFNTPDSDALDSSCSSKESSPTSDYPGLSSSVPNICPNMRASSSNDSGLEFDNEYFNMDRRMVNHSFRSVRSPSKRMKDMQSLSFDVSRRAGSLRHDYKSSTSLEQFSYRSLIDGQKKKSVEASKESLTACVTTDPELRHHNQNYLNSIATNIESLMNAFIDAVTSEHKNDELNTHSSKLKHAITEVCSWVRLAHAALRLHCESAAWSRELAALQTRRDTCFSQALTTLTSGLLSWLYSTSQDTVVKLISSGLGPLCGFEGLLSLYSAEKPMWGDMVVGVEDLQTVVFVLEKVTTSNSSFPQISGIRGALTLHLPISDSLYAKFDSKEPISFTITAVLFNVGINEKASLAEALGETAPQYRSNRDNIDRLAKYHNRYSKLFPPEHNRSSSRTKPLEEVMENLQIVVQKKVPKNVEVLQLAALATRLMNGIRFTSCKSAKDRTGMSVTLEQCSILSTEYHLAEHEIKKALDVMRSEGCRRENTNKNIGARKYAFTKKQVMSLPEHYRPPAGTYGSSQT